MNAFSLFSVFFSRGLKHASISLQLWLQLILIHGFVWYVLFRIIFHLGNFWSGNPPCRILWHIWRCRIIVFLSYSLCTFIVQLKVIPSLSGSLSMWWFCAWKWAGNVYLHLLPYQNIYYLWKGTIKFYLASHIMLQRVEPAAPGRRICRNIMTKNSVSTLFFIKKFALGHLAVFHCFQRKWYKYSMFKMQENYDANSDRGRIIDWKGIPVCGRVEAFVRWAELRTVMNSSSVLLIVKMQTDPGICVFV